MRTRPGGPGRPRSFRRPILQLLVLLGAFASMAAPLPCDAASGPALIDTHFVLTGLDGRQVTDENFRGKWLLVYFGYTSCPDVCPTVLSQISASLRELGARADRFQPIFITLDPARDSTKVLSVYLKAFGSRFVGLRGSGEDIAETAQRFHAYYRLRGLGNGQYSVDHSSYIYVIDPKGRFTELLTGDLPGHSLTAALKKLAG